MKQEVLITGSSGLVGSRIVDVLSSEFSFHGIGTQEHPNYPGFENLNKYSQCNIEDLYQFEKILDTSAIKIIVHCAAFLPGVDLIEEQRSQGTSSQAWRINVKGTERIAKLADKYKIHFILASSTYIYDGKTGLYKETDDPLLSDTSKMSFYGIIKRMQELITRDNCDKWSAFRFEMPYRTSFTKTDFARRLISLFKDNNLNPLFSDQTITPIYLDELAKAVGILIKTQEKGPFNIGSSDVISPHGFASLLIDLVFGEGEGKKIEEANYANTPKNPSKAVRPLKSGVVMQKILDLGYEAKTNKQMIQEFIAKNI